MSITRSLHPRRRVLAELIEQNGLRQRDLVPLLGTESVVSEIVNGKRPLSKIHIEKLSRRFRGRQPCSSPNTQLHGVKAFKLASGQHSPD